jgi:DNA (cytosine-5)-methyltransferase 1
VLPDAHHDPTQFRQVLVSPPVTHDIPSQLLGPPGLVGFWLSPVIRTSVPEAAVNEHSHSFGGEGQVRSPSGHARKGGIDPVPKTPCVEKPAQRHLNLCVSTPLGRHAARSGGVGQGSRCSRQRHEAILPQHPQKVRSAGYRSAMSRASRLSPPTRTHVLDLFSGAGGLTQGFHEASEGFTTVRAVESDVAAAASYTMNHGGVAFAGSIEDWLRSEDVPDADVVIGGPPCQGFSSLGKQDVEDARNQLWRRYADVISKAEPKYFVVENVATFLNSPQLQRFRAQTYRNGRLRTYTFQARILNAADYGAAQVRRRVVLIGHHRDLEFPGFPKPTHDRDSWPTLKQALSGLPERVHDIALPDRWTHFADRDLPGPFKTNELHLARSYEPVSLERFGYIGEGENRFKIPYHLLAPCWRRHTTGSTDVMGRLSWDRPSVTIRTEFFKPEKGRYLHPREHRALTHQEAARIQGFPDNYQWVGSKVAIARQIGNAVPIQLGAAIARQLLGCVD